MNSEHIPICYTVDKMIFLENAHFRLGIGLDTSKIILDYGIIDCNTSKGIYFSLRFGKFCWVSCLWK